jgi:DNA-binding CsgD family transcriptional regulator
MIWRELNVAEDSLSPDEIVAREDPESARVGLDTAVAAMSAAIASVGRRGFEGDLCALLQATTGYESIAIIAFTVPGKPHRLYDNLSPVDQQRALDPYLAGAYLLDPWYYMILQEVPDGIYRLSDLAPDDFEQSEYYHRYYARAGCHDECGMFIRVSSSVCIVISLVLYGTVCRAEIDLQSARSLFPCIKALCLRHWGELSVEQTGPHETLEDLCRRKGLSSREGQVTALVLRGYSNKLIARELDLSPETVKVYRKRVHRKLGTSSSREIFTSFFALASDTTLT